MRTILLRCTVLLVLACVPALATGCADQLRTTISVYHTLPERMSRTTYAFVPLKGQQDSNENLEYRDLIREALLQHDLIETNLSKASLLVSFSYGIDNGREREVDELFDKRTFTEYRRALWIYVFDKVPSTNEPGTMRYEGGALCSGEALQLGTVMPAMIKELFREFPGRSGMRRIEYISP